MLVVLAMLDCILAPTMILVQMLTDRHYCCKHSRSHLHYSTASAAAAGQVVVGAPVVDSSSAPDL